MPPCEAACRAGVSKAWFPPSPMEQGAQRCPSSPPGAYDWAQTTLRLHAKDKRPFLYELQQLEQATTHDPLWNAAQVGDPKGPRCIPWDPQPHRGGCGRAVG